MERNCVYFMRFFHFIIFILLKINMFIEQQVNNAQWWIPSPDFD